MDFLIEGLIQLVVEILGQIIAEIAFDAFTEGLARALTSRIGRFVVGGLGGFGFGLFWGVHLSGNPHWPRLLWVSLAIGIAAAVLAFRSTATTRFVLGGSRTVVWREVLAPPWRWQRDRFLGLVIINVGLVLGLLIAFTPGH